MLHAWKQPFPRLTHAVGTGGAVRGDTRQEEPCPGSKHPIQDLCHTRQNVSTAFARRPPRAGLLQSPPPPEHLTATSEAQPSPDRHQSAKPGEGPDPESWAARGDAFHKKPKLRHFCYDILIPAMERQKRGRPAAPPQRICHVESLQNL